jgi:hypothetical protein
MRPMPRKNSVWNIKSFLYQLFMLQEHSIFILKTKNGSKQTVTTLGTYDSYVSLEKKKIVMSLIHYILKINK